MLSRRASIALASVGVTVPAVALAQSVGVAPAIPESTDMDGTIPGVLGVVVSAVLVLDKIGLINIPSRDRSQQPAPATTTSPTATDAGQSERIAVLESRLARIERDQDAIATDLRAAVRTLDRIEAAIETERARGDSG